MSVNYPIAIEEPGFNGSYMEPNRCSATITYIVPENELDQAVFTFLGFSYRQGSALRRVLPQRHPYWRHLHAVRTQEHGRAFRQKANVLEGQIDQYDARLVTVYYEALPFQVKADGTVTAEYQRFMRKLYHPAVEIYTLRAGTFIFDLADGAPSDAPIAADLPFRLPIIEWEWTWFQVPRSWLFGNAAGASVATNLMNRLETVNDMAFEGCATKTLRLTSCDFEEVYTPAPDLIVDAPGVGEQPWLRYNVHLKFKYNPEGWHKLPHPQTMAFYRIKTSGGNEPFLTSSFPNMFLAVT